MVDFTEWWPLTALDETKDDVAATSACSRSAMRQSEDSRPTDRRTRLSVMPSFFLSSGGTDACVMMLLKTTEVPVILRPKNII